MVRDGLGFFWDARHTLDQEKYGLFEESSADPALSQDIALIKTILAKYPPAPTNGLMFERYLKEKEGKRELWDTMVEKVLKQHGKKQL